MRTFTKQNTNIAKGMACILLLVHHLFYAKGSWTLFFSIGGLNPPLIAIPARMAKVCVAIFVILSGYGLTKSQTFKNWGGGTYISTILKLYMQYWYIYVIFIPLGFIFGRSPLQIYAGSDLMHKIVYFLGDVLGISNLFHWPTMNATWWFMGAIIPLYLMFPLLLMLTKKLPLVALILSFILCVIENKWSHTLTYWIFPFIVGIFLADKNLLDKFLNLTWKISCPVVIAAFLIFAYMRLLYGIKVDTFWGLSIILVSVLLFGRIKYINNILEFIGIHSGNIFMFHTFIYYYYFKGFIYGFKYPVIIFTVLIGICLLISVGIEKSKYLTRYNKLQKYVLTKLKG